jgi:hypothetical protein
MTAMSAPRSASEPAAAEHADLAPVRLPGSARTYEVRDILRGMGLRWDPISHAWHGTLNPERRALLERNLGLRPRPVVPIEAFSTPGRPVQGPPAAARAFPRPVRTGSEGAPPSSRPRDSSRTRVEARIAFPDAGNQDERSPTRFSTWDTTSGLLDDSREADERAEELRLRDLRGRVKAARKAIAITPGAAEAMRADWLKEAGFLAQFGITQAQFRRGVLGNEPSDRGPEVSR